LASSSAYGVPDTPATGNLGFALKAVDTDNNASAKCPDALTMPENHLERLTVAHVAAANVKARRIIAATIIHIRSFSFSLRF